MSFAEKAPAERAAPIAQPRGTPLVVQGVTPSVSRMQRTLGNRATISVLGGAVVQRRMRDADEIAELVNPVMRGTVKKSETLAKIKQLYASLLADPNMPAAKKLGVLQNIADSTKAWADVHQDDKGRRSVALALRAEHAEATREMAALKGQNPGLKPDGYKPEENRILRKSQVKDLNVALKILAGMVDLVCPVPGNKGEVELEVDIPVHPGVFVGFRFKVEADRPDPEKVKCRVEVAFTGGAHLPHAMGRAAGELGGFSEAQGRSAHEVMNLFSYGLYRRARESRWSNRELTNVLWGGSHKEEGFQAAEQWAGGIEKDILGVYGDAYVSSGGFGRGAAEVGIDHVGKVAGDLQVGSGLVYDKAGITNIANAKGAWTDAKVDAVANAVWRKQPRTLGERREMSDELAKDTHIVSASVLGDIVELYDDVVVARFLSKAMFRTEIKDNFGRTGVTRRGLDAPVAQQPTRGTVEKSKAEHLTYFKTSGQVNFGPGMAAAKVEGAWQSRGRDSLLTSHLREAKIEVKAGLVLPASKLMSGGWVEGLNLETAAAGIIELIKATNQKGSKMGGKRVAAQSAGAAPEAAELATQLAHAPKDQFTSALATSAPLKEGVTGSETLQLVVEGKVKGQKPGEEFRAYELRISIGQEQAMRGEFTVARVKAKTFHRWAMLGAKWAGKATAEGDRPNPAWSLDVAGRQVALT